MSLSPSGQTSPLPSLPPFETHKWGKENVLSFIKSKFCPMLVFLLQMGLVMMTNRNLFSFPFGGGAVGGGGRPSSPNPTCGLDINTGKLKLSHLGLFRLQCFSAGGSQVHKIS
jgi:hypothetical protein